MSKCNLQTLFHSLTLQNLVLATQPTVPSAGAAAGHLAPTSQRPCCIHYLVFIHPHCPLNILKIYSKGRKIQLLHRRQPMRTLGESLVLSEGSGDYIKCNYCLKLEGRRLLAQLPLKWCSSLELLPGFMVNINVFCCLAINISKIPFPVVDRCTLALSRCLPVTMTISICCKNK